MRDLFFLRWRSVVRKATSPYAAGKTECTGAQSESRTNQRQSKTANLVSVRRARSFRMRCLALPDLNRSFLLPLPPWVLRLFPFTPYSATEKQPFWQFSFRAIRSVVLLNLFSDLS